MAKNTKTTVEPTVRIEEIAPNVGVELSIQSADLVTMGYIALKNALSSELRVRVAEIADIDGRRAELSADKHNAVHALDEPAFDTLVGGRCDVLRDVFGLPGGGEQGLVESKSVAHYDRKAGRKFEAVVKYKSDAGDDVATFAFSRVYPTPAHILDMEARLDALDARKAAADKKARELRTQIQDRDGLRDQVSAGLTRKLLGHANATGRLMLDALVDGVSDVENPILALLDNRDGK